MVEVAGHLEKFFEKSLFEGRPSAAARIAINEAHQNSERASGRSSLERYFGEISAIRVLTQEEEVHLGRLIRKAYQKAYAELSGLPLWAVIIDRELDRYSRGEVAITNFSRMVFDPGFEQELSSEERAAQTSERANRIIEKHGDIKRELQTLKGALTNLNQHELADQLRIHETKKYDRSISKLAELFRAMPFTEGYLQTNMFLEIEEQARAALTLKRALGRSKKGSVEESQLEGSRRELEARIGMKLDAFLRGTEAIRRDVPDAKAPMIKHNLKLVVHVAKDFRHWQGIAFIDLIQEGNIGLLRAVERWDPERGHKFSTYAVWWVRQACIRAIQNQARTIRLPTHYLEQRTKHDRLVQEYERKEGHSMAIAERAQLLNMSEEGYAEWIDYGRGILSLNDTSEGKDGDRGERGDLVKDTNSPSPEADSQISRRVKLTEELMDAANLNSYERHTIEQRFIEDRTLQDVGEDLGVSRERARQYEERALIKLRNTMHKSDESGVGGRRLFDLFSELRES